MKVEWRLFLGVGIFLIPVTVVYWFMSSSQLSSGGDWTGTTALTMSVLLCFLVAFFVWYTGNHVDVRPEDRSDAEIADGAGDLGFYSPYSWWPLAVAAAAATMFMGVVFGWWLFIIGAAAVALAVMGFVFEYFTGEAKH